MDSYILKVEPILDDLRPDHPAHVTAVSELIEAGPKPSIRPGVESNAGTKGPTADLVWQIGAPAASAIVASLVRAWRLWLARDRRRSLRISVEAGDGAKVDIAIDGDNLSIQSVQSALDAAVASLGRRSDQVRGEPV